METTNDIAVNDKVKIISVIFEKKGLCCQSATLADFEAMEAIENEHFADNPKAFKKKDFIKWENRNPDMLYVVKEKETGTVLGFTILAPLSEELYGKLKRGEISDMYDFEEEMVPENMKSDYLYLADICVTKNTAYDFRTLFMASFLLIGSAIILIHRLKAQFVIGSPITESGKKICASNFFEFVTNDKDGKPIWELAVTEERYSFLAENFKIPPETGNDSVQPTNEEIRTL